MEIARLRAQQEQARDVRAQADSLRAKRQVSCTYFRLDSEANGNVKDFAHASLPLVLKQAWAFVPFCKGFTKSSGQMIG